MRRDRLAPILIFGVPLFIFALIRLIHPAPDLAQGLLFWALVPTSPACVAFAAILGLRTPLALLATQPYREKTWADRRMLILVIAAVVLFEAALFSQPYIPLGYPVGKFGRPPRLPVGEVTFADAWGRAYRP